MDKQEAATAFGVTKRTITNWVGRGMPLGRGAAGWVKKFINPAPRKGGKLPGAGRKKRNSKGQIANRKSGAAKTERAPELRSRAQRIARIRSGDATKAEIAYTDDETRSLERTLDFETKQKGLVPAAETRLAWTRAFQLVKDNILSVPAGAARDAAVEFALSQDQELRLRALLEGKMGRAFAAIADEQHTANSTQRT